MSATEEQSPEGRGWDSRPSPIRYAPREDREILSERIWHHTFTGIFVLSSLREVMLGEKRKLQWHLSFVRVSLGPSYRCTDEEVAFVRDRFSMQRAVECQEAHPLDTLSRVLVLDCPTVFAAEEMAS